MSSEPLIYLNGDILEYEETRISPFDRGFLWGDGIYEVTPCFDGKLFRLEDHLERLYRSLKYVRIDPGVTIEEMHNITLKTLSANEGRLETGGMYRLGHWITRGIDNPSTSVLEAGPSTVMVFLRQADVTQIAKNQATGVRLSVTATRRNPPECIEARAKVTSKMNQILAELDAASNDSLSLMLDIQGNVAENSVANFFIVREGVVITPPERNILEGVTRKVVLELCDKLGIELQERDFTMYEVAQADECFITSSAVCAMPVREIDRFRPKSEIPGPINSRLISAFVEETGYNFRNYF